MYKTFDWEQAQSQTKNQRKLQWIKENCEREVTEQEFVDAIYLLKAFRQGYLQSKYTPSKLRYQYRNLKEGFGFFTGNKIK